MKQENRLDSYVASTPLAEMERVDIAPFELGIDEDGCVRQPEELREKMLAQKAGPLIAQLVDGELRLITPKAAIRKVKGLISRQEWGTDSTVDQLILERRAEALREHAEDLLPTYDW